MNTLLEVLALLRDNLAQIEEDHFSDERNKRRKQHRDLEKDVEEDIETNDGVLLRDLALESGPVEAHVPVREVFEETKHRRNHIVEAVVVHLVAYALN